MKAFLISFTLISIVSITSAQSVKKTIQQRVDSVIRLMTLTEKIGQLNQYNGDWEATGPITFSGDKPDEIRKGLVGSMLNVKGVQHIRQCQELAMQSRLKIPMIFGQDVIHGYKTTFPIPLAEAASWDTAAIRMSARVAAKEAAASGLQWTFAPMVDIARDPRWGRIMEGAGEDPFLGSRIATARVKGFQGNKLGDLDAVMACAKHFCAYGAAVGGRDYNSVDMSERALWEIYLPPFRAALDAGVATFMSSFNDLNGIPATGNRYLLSDILKGKWKYKGFVVSDWGSIGEMVNHGFVKDNYEAAQSAISAGCDMDMESRSYRDNIAQLLKDKKITMQSINEAVRRVLYKKFELGLFDDPYRYCSSERENAVLNDPENAIAARRMAERSIVLLKNQGHLLPLSKTIKKIAFIGPLVKAVKENKGFWDVEVPGVDSSFIVSQWEGVKNKLGESTELLYAMGCGIEDTATSNFTEAIAVAKEADVVIISVGEARNMSGEAKSRSNIHLPGVQEDLVKAVCATGKPVVVMINAGRPLVFNWIADNAPAILYTWWLGSEAGNAIADVLFGDYNPSAKLPVTFPRSEGQVPIYYNHFNTGRPAGNDSDKLYRSAYIDLSIYPKYAFGYGLSYTTFTYGNLRLSSDQMKKDGKIEVALIVSNTGKYDGEEVVQLYIRDKVASVVRPVMELKDFKKIFLKVGEAQTIHFTIDKEKLSFYNNALQWIAEPGEFDLMIGSSSDDIRIKHSFIMRN